MIVFQAEWHLTTILDNHLEIGKFIIDVLDATTRRCEGGSRDLPPSKGFVTCIEYLFKGISEPFQLVSHIKLH